MQVLGCEASISLVFNPGFGAEVNLAQQLVSYFAAFDRRLTLCRDLPKILGPLLWKFSSACRSFRDTIAKMKGTMVPEILRRIEHQQQSTEGSQDPFILDAIIRFALKEGSRSNAEYADLIADEAIFLCFEIAGPVSMVITILLYRIIRNPEYINPLREELTEALKRANRGYSYQMFDDLPKLDSFTKETLRLDGPAVLGGTRLAMKPLALRSLGMALPSGTQVTLPARSIHLDADYYPDPKTFNGYRFYNADSEGRNVCDIFSVSDIWMAFGVGTSACPARRMGTRVAQLVFARMLLQYDIESADKMGRDLPTHIFVDADAVPNPEIKMRIRGRLCSEAEK
ncbi:cytochrome P450 [Aspergillus spectabilis]